MVYVLEVLGGEYGGNRGVFRREIQGNSAFLSAVVGYSERSMT